MRKSSLQEFGTVYVLINASMPGLVKIGKTQRTAQERAEELSSATGVATPFLVVYEHFFDNVSEAENSIHVLLESRGMRLSSNREFFVGEVSEIIKLIVKLSNSSNAKPDIDEAYNVEQAQHDDFLSEFQIDEAEEDPSEDLYKAGLDAKYGLGDTIRDEAEAYSLFKQAAALGSTEALLELGEMHEYGHHVRKDKSKALHYYKEAIKKGNFFGYSAIAIMFFYLDRVSDGDKAWAMFISAFEKEPMKAFSKWTLRNPAQVIEDYIFYVLMTGSTPKFHNIFAIYREDIVTRIEDSILSSAGNKRVQDLCIAGRNWINSATS